MIVTMTFDVSPHQAVMLDALQGHGGMFVVNNPMVKKRDADALGFKAPPIAAIFHSDEKTRSRLVGVVKAAIGAELLAIENGGGS